MGKQLKKPWNDFKTDAYSIPGVSEVHHRNEPGWKEKEKKNLNPFIILVAAISLLGLIAAYFFLK